jgi:hypothetical protein
MCHIVVHSVIYCGLIQLTKAKAGLALRLEELATVGVWISLRSSFIRTTSKQSVGLISLLCKDIAMLTKRNA